MKDQDWVGHTPVMVEEVIEALAPRAGAVLIDATFGGGGHSKAILAAAPCRIWAVDCDWDAVERGKKFSRTCEGRLAIFHGHFGDIENLLESHGIFPVDGITFDLGVSSWQLSLPDRGFSFQQNGPLDMRMNISPGKGALPTAADLLNRDSEDELADLFSRFGEEPRARHIASAIVKERRNNPITHTLQLADLVCSVVGRGHRVRHPATRVFQALRIAVNGELGPKGQLTQGLKAAERLLKPGGRLVVISFHSLEDREVKQFMMRRCDKKRETSRHRPPLPDEARPPSFRLLFRKPRRPSRAEVERNPRARSARLRAVERTTSPPWSTAGVA